MSTRLGSTDSRFNGQPNQTECGYFVFMRVNKDRPPEHPLKKGEKKSQQPRMIPGKQNKKGRMKHRIRSWLGTRKNQGTD